MWYSVGSEMHGYWSQADQVLDSGHSILLTDHGNGTASKTHTLSIRCGYNSTYLLRI